jgi:hypothetical protein
MATTERRHLVRHAIDVDATIITPSASLPGRAVDISAGGIRVIATQPVPPDTVVALSLETTSETLLSGMILWTIEVHLDKQPVVYEMGIDAHGFILREQEAIAQADREAMVQEILSRIPTDSIPN